jgi:predicted nucleic acid-binding Zn ribbon protein
MSESWEVYCPKCKSEHLERIFFPTPAVFNGKGFYKTDNRIPLTDDE